MKTCLFLLGLLLSASVSAVKLAPTASEAAVEARLTSLSTELRCLVCQNESLASSHAPLAEDLRNVVRSQIRAGQSDEQIIQYLTDRYGDFVNYRPPFKLRTALLWLAPPLLLLAGLGVLVYRLRRRRTVPAQSDPKALEALRREFDGEAS